jgi:hypothetical protein
LYEEYVGVNLKSKTFIDQMGKWETVFQTPDKTTNVSHNE